MSERYRVPEHEHFSDATMLLVAVLVDLVAILFAVLTFTNSYAISGTVVGAATVITGVLIRKAVGRKAMWLCFFLAILVVVVGIFLQSSMMVFT